MEFQTDGIREVLLSSTFCNVTYHQLKFILLSSTSFNLGVGLVVVQAKNSGSGRGSSKLALLLPLNWASLPFHYHYFCSLFRLPKVVVVEVKAGPMKW